MEGLVDITTSEIQQLRPWIKESVVKLQGFVDQDEFLAKAIIDCLENQRPRQKLLGILFCSFTLPLYISHLMLSFFLSLMETTTEQLKMFNLEERSVRELLASIEQQTKMIRDKKKQMRMEKRKHTKISFGEEEEKEGADQRKTKRTKETNLESLRAMETAAASVLATPTTSVKDDKTKDREKEERDRSSRDKERSSRDKERSRSSRDKDRDKDKRDKSRHDRDKDKSKDKHDHRKEHRSSSSSKEKGDSDKTKTNGGQQPTTPAVTIPAISLPQPEDLQAKV